MSSAEGLRESGSKSSSADLVEQACERLEREWSSGKRRTLERLIRELPPEIHALAFTNLLKCELRLAQHDEASLQQLRERFPSDSALVDQVLDEWLKTRPLALPVAETEVQQFETVSTATRYHCRHKMWSGNMSELYKAQDPELNRDVIIKRLSPLLRQEPQYPEFVKQLEAEAEFTARLDHQGIAPVYGKGLDWDKQPFFVMQVIDGVDLLHAIKEYHKQGGPGNQSKQGRDHLCRLLNHLVSACNTIAFAHGALVLHCDLKPQNIMIGRKYGETFVIDWGLARNYDPSSHHRPPGWTIRPQDSSQSDVQGYTLGYVSPEQFSGDPDIGPASDIYSLGAVLFQILTNTRPFDGCSKTEFSRRLALGDVDAPRKFDSKIPKTLEVICLKAMHVSPEKRHRTAQELATDLQNWMRDEEVESAPDGVLARAFRWARRHRVVATASLVVFVVLIMAGIAIALEARRVTQANKLREEAESHFETALKTFEDLSAPLEDGEQIESKVWAPIALSIEKFTEEFERGYANSPTRQSARILRIRARAAQYNGPEAAAKEYSVACTTYQDLCDKNRQDLTLLGDLAATQLNYARQLLHADRSEAAEAPLKAALNNLEMGSSATDKDNSLLPLFRRRQAEALHALGECYLNLANQSGDRERLKGSEECFLRSLELTKELIEEKFTRVNNKHDETQSDIVKKELRHILGRRYGYLGDNYLRQGRINKAYDAYLESLAIRQKLWKTAPSVPKYRFQYARGLANFSGLTEVAPEYQVPEQFEPAMKQLAEARDIAAALHSEYPYEPDYASDVGWMSNKLAEMHFISAARAENSAENKATHEAKASELIAIARQAMDTPGIAKAASTRVIDKSKILEALLLARASKEANKEKAKALAFSASDSLLSLEPKE